MINTLPNRKLGHDGPDVSVVCLGTWPLGGGMGFIEEKQALKTVHAALDAGINFIDTAEGYKTSESLLERATKNSYKIDKIWVTLSPVKREEKVLWVKNNSIKNRSWKF